VHVAEIDDDPATPRVPDLVQALGTLIENAASFAGSRVAIVAWSDAATIFIDIVDDGPGFAPEILARLGEPYVSTRVGEGEHMGLGIFIAGTLLARHSGTLSFRNEPHGGACVTVAWPKAAFGASAPRRSA
jgi:two-component system sensor histidine kinase RegB